MADLTAFREKLREFYRRATPFDDKRKATQQDLADAVGLHRSELNSRLHGTKAATLTNRDVRSIVRTLVEWGAISTRVEASLLLKLAACPPFTPEEWLIPPFDLLLVTTDTSTPTTTAKTALTATIQTFQLTHNLPHPLTSFIGRSQNISDLWQLFCDPSTSRLVTLTGTGGAGKTRLALQLAFQLQSASLFPDGIWLVELAPLQSKEDIL
jgi:hypothetical protein